MRIAFRVDASSSIGSGHLARCLTLGSHLSTFGARVDFVCRRLDQYSRARLSTVTHRVIVLEDFLTTEGQVTGEKSPEAVWSPLDQQTDAIAVIKALGGRAHYDWLIVDHYGLDSCWERIVRPVANRLMVIDDLGNREHDCELLLDQGDFSGEKNRYSHQIPDGCRVALGPGYALLSREYRSLRCDLIGKPGALRSQKNIVVCFGGTDQKNLYQLVIQAFKSANLKGVNLQVVLGGTGRHIGLFRSQTQCDQSIQILDQTASLAEPMARASLFIGGIGHTTWERCCLGVPGLGISLAQNQEQLARRLQHIGALRWIGKKKTITYRTILEELKRFFQTGVSDTERELLYRLVDGKGVSRVMTALSAERSSEVNIRSAKEEDGEELLHWVNDSKTTHFSFRRKTVEISEHLSWLKKQLTSEDVEMFVGEISNAMPIGQVRFNRQQTSWRITYSVESTVRGFGYGRQLLKKGMQALKEKNHTGTVYAEVHSSNQASLALFRQLEFTLVKGRSENILEFRKEIT